MVQIIPLSAAQVRQVEQAEADFRAAPRAEADARALSGWARWEEVKGQVCLLRQVEGSAAVQNLGPRDAGTELLYEGFLQNAPAARKRWDELREALAAHETRNRDMGLGVVPPQTLDRLRALTLRDGLVTGPVALQGYALKAGVRLEGLDLVAGEVDLVGMHAAHARQFFWIDTQGRMVLAAAQKPRSFGWRSYPELRDIAAELAERVPPVWTTEPPPL